MQYRAAGALARIDGIVAGAFDGEHRNLPLAPHDGEQALTLDVERATLPTWGLPPGPGVWWTWIRRARKVSHHAELVETTAHHGVKARPATPAALPLIGHSHLDVAWLWTIAETRRKAARTFAIAAEQVERNPDFVFVQSQPQLYAFVKEDQPALFERVAALTAASRFDASVATMWVEPDCNIPSGESLLRQLVHGMRFTESVLRTRPTIAWLPDTFGFPNTIPTLLAHAGIGSFMTTKLNWNDTTRFPHAQFRWRGPDGSIVVAAIFAAYGGWLTERRARIAAERNEPLVVGAGDGGGGVTERALENAPSIGTWVRAGAWFEQLARRAASLPAYEGELYLEYHRGVATTHREIKRRNAALERGLELAEELCAWCLAVRAPSHLVDVFMRDLQHAWTIVLRHQFHDTLSGTGIAAVYEEVRTDYERAETIVARVVDGARSILPQSSLKRNVGLAEPVAEGGDWIFDNGFIRARVQPTGAIIELAAAQGRNVMAQGNLLTAYVDRPKQWEAWNIDASYKRKRKRVRADGAEIVEDGLEIRFAIGDSRLLMRVSLGEQDPFLRVDLVADWRESRTLLRCEQWLAIDARSAVFGTPHGTIVRPAFPSDDADRAKFEFPAQRFAAIAGPDGAGLAILVPDIYGWGLRGLQKGGIHAGMSLLRGTRWPDPTADIGPTSFTFAYAPFDRAPIGAIERVWYAFAHDERVPLFTADDESTIVVATKPADDGDGVIVRVRECDGGSRLVRLACGGRAKAATTVDALEREVPGAVALEDGALVFSIAPYALRAFRVRF